MQSLDGRNRAIVIAQSLARVIAAIQIASVRWRSYLPPNHRDWSSQSLRSLCCDSNRAIGVRSFSCFLAFVPRGTAVWLERVDCVRWELAIGNWRFCPSKMQSKIHYSMNISDIQLLLSVLRQFFAVALALFCMGSFSSVHLQLPKLWEWLILCGCCFRIFQNQFRISFLGRVSLWAGGFWEL